MSASEFLLTRGLQWTKLSSWQQGLGLNKANLLPDGQADPDSRMFCVSVCVSVYSKTSP